MTKEEFISNKMKILVGKEGYNKSQAYMIALNYWDKENKTKAQQGTWYDNNPNFSNGFQYNLGQPPIAYNGENPDLTGLGQNPNYIPMPTSSGYNFTGTNLDLNQRQQDRLVNNFNRDNYQEQAPQQVGTPNPFSGVGLEGALNYAGRGFGEKDPYKAGVGTATALLKGTRNFLSGYGTGKADRQTYDDYIKRLYNPELRPEMLQQGGKIKTSEVLAMNAVTNNPNGNVNTEDGEFIKRTNGMVQPVVGEPHIKNGRKAEGVDVELNDGDKVLSNYIKLRPSDIKELKERYKISLKKGDTPAKALERIEAKIGLKKEIDKLAESAEKLEKALKIKDKTTRDLSIETLKTIIATQNEKISNLKEVSAVAFDELFEAQEEIPKKDTSKLYDDNGKEVEDTDNMQQGGIYELASKFGISKERAEELVQMQMGGEMPQEQPQEEQIMQAVMEMLQQGLPPEQIIEQLIQSGVPEEFAIQAVEMMMQQSPQEEQVEGQMSNPQNGVPQEQMEMAQQGGRIGNKYENPELFKKQNATSEDWSSFGELLKEKPQEVLSEIKRVHPELYNIYFKDGKVNKSNIAEFQIAVNNKYDSILQDAESLYGKDSQEVKNLQSQIEKDKFLLEQGNIRDVDAMLGNYTATRPNFELKILPKEDLDKVNKAGVNTASQLKEKFPDLYKQYVEPKGLKSDFWLGSNQPVEANSAQTPLSPQSEVANNQVQSQQIKARNNFPMLPQDLRLPPSGVPALLKSEIELGRIEPIKMTPEPMLAEQARQQLTAQQQLQATGLPPQIQQALQAQNLASGQFSANDAISKVENFNNQNQFQADTFNLQQRAKEDITNEQFAQDFQSKMLGSISNSERDYRAYLTEGNLQNRADWRSVENMNLLNRMSENYKYNIGNGVEYIPSVSGNIGSNSAPTPEQLANWTPEQLEVYKRNMSALAKKTMYNQQTL